MPDPSPLPYANALGRRRGPLISFRAPPVRAAPAAAVPSRPTGMEWFRDAKLGIFIHWGVYSQGVGSESWAFHYGETTYEAYMAKAATFTAANYHPENGRGSSPRRDELCRPDRASTMTVFPSGHEALEAQRQGFLAGRPGSARPYCDALRKEGLRVGLSSLTSTTRIPTTRACFRLGGQAGCNTEYSNHLAILRDRRTRKPGSASSPSQGPA